MSTLSIDFQKIRSDALSLPEPQKNHALEAAQQVEGMTPQINAMLSQYENGNKAMRSAIETSIDSIVKRVLSPSGFPPTFNRSVSGMLEGVLNPIKLRCEAIREALFAEETQKEIEKVALEKAKDDKLSLVLCKEQELYLSYSSFTKAFLQKLKDNIADQNASPTVYMAYAWPTEERTLQEDWVQDFLKNLQSHLKLGGVPTVRLDFKSNRYGNNINEYMKQAQTDDYVLLFGTESLKDKHEIGLSAVCTEMIEILRKRQIDIKKGLRRVFPILISGNLRSSYPPEYERYTTVKDWRKGDYLTHLQSLYLELFNFSPEDYLDGVEEFLKSTCEAYPQEGAIIESKAESFKKAKRDIAHCKTIDEVNNVCVS